jgi:hypothetical protein
MERRRIDVHQHIIPKHYVEWLEQSGISHAGGTHIPTWSADATINLMDRHGIATGSPQASSRYPPLGSIFGPIWSRIQRQELGHEE